MPTGSPNHIRIMTPEDILREWGSNSDGEEPDDAGTDSTSSQNASGTADTPDVDRGPSTDFYASVHTVEIDRGTHREKRSLRFYHDDGRPIRPGESADVQRTVSMPREALEELGADPDHVFTAHIREDANVPAPAGSIAAFEPTGDGAVRYLGTIDELGGRIVSE